MKFNVFFRLRGPQGDLSLPHAKNPIVADSMRFLLQELLNQMPDNPNLGLKTIGLTITPPDIMDQQSGPGDFKLGGAGINLVRDT